MTDRDRQPTIGSGASGSLRSDSEEKDIITSADASLSGAADEIAQYLKDGETVVECIARNRADTDAVLTLLAREKRRSKLLYDALQTVMRYAPGYDWNADDEKLTLVTGEAFQAYEQYFALSGAASTPAEIERLKQRVWQWMRADSDFDIPMQHEQQRKDLDALIAAVRQSPPVHHEKDEKNLSRSDQPQLRASESDPRDAQLAELRLYAENCADRTDDYGKGLYAAYRVAIEILAPDPAVVALVKAMRDEVGR